MRGRHALPLLLGLLACLQATGCGPQVATYIEHDPSLEFGDLATYDWASPDPPPGTNDILDARVREAVDAALPGRGLRKVTDGAAPDILVAYTAAVENDLQSVTVDRYHGYSQVQYLRQSGESWNRPRSTMGTQKVVYEYQQGSLILDFSLPEPRRLVWRGYARAAFRADRSQDDRDALLRQAVRKMLAGFPPK